MRCVSWCLFAGRTVPRPATSPKGMPQRRSDLVDHDCLVYPGLTPVLKVADEQDRLHQLKLHMPIQPTAVWYC